MRFIRYLISVFFIIFLFSSLIKNIFNHQKKIQFYQEYKKEYEKEKKQNLVLQTELLKKKDPKEIEKTIRNNLNLLKPDEIAIMLPEPTPLPKNITPTPLPNWQQWWQLFLK